MPRVKKAAAEAPEKKARKPRVTKKDRVKSAPKVASAEVMNDFLGDESNEELNQDSLIMLDKQGLTGLVIGGRQYEVWTRHIHREDRVILGNLYKKGTYTGWDSPSFFSRLELALKFAINHVIRENLKGNSTKSIEDVLNVVSNIHKKFDVDVVQELLSRISK